MQDEKLWTDLANISIDIFGECSEPETFEWEIQKNIGNVTTFNQDNAYECEINNVKSLLDEIASKSSNCDSSPQSDYIKSLFLVDLQNIKQKLSEYKDELTRATLISQNINSQEEGLYSEPVIISIPLN